MEIKLRSHIHKEIPEEAQWELIQLSFRGSSVFDTNILQSELFEICKKYNIDATPLGCGTNRFGLKIKQYCYKFAVNDEGRMDNKKEFIFCKRLQPHVVYVHEVTSDGIMQTCQYINAFKTYGEYVQYSDEAFAALEWIFSKYLIGDIGMCSKNAGNAGIDEKGNFRFLDFAYVFSCFADIFKCPLCGNQFRASHDYVSLVCDCGRKESFEMLRRRISDEHEQAEVDMIPDIGYEIDCEEKIVTLDPNKSPVGKNSEDINFKKYLKQQMEANRSYDIQKYRNKFKFRLGE
jgi:hypothetical protein